MPPGNSGGGQWTDGGGGGGGSGGSDRGPIPANSDSGASEEGRSFELVQNTTQDGDEPPQIPKNPPPSKRKGPSLAKNIVATLNRAGKIAALVAGSTPSGRAIKITSLLIEYYPDVSDWVEENIVPYIVSYFDEPKDLETLHSAVSNPAPGYQTHHIAEQEAARIDGFPKELIDGYDNTVRIPTLKHWEVTGWFGRSNKRFGGLSPREYLRGKSWEERTKVGLEALIERGVLKP
ncbi:MAG: hypothetical protein M5U16_10320 [Hyphomicrobium sp.]|nr:hypothetical protein [Hyphomicrobium sp.]